MDECLILGTPAALLSAGPEERFSGDGLKSAVPHTATEAVVGEMELQFDKEGVQWFPCEIL